MAFIEPLNLEQLFLVTLSGSALIFTFLSLIVISALAARFKMPNIVFGVLIVLFGVIMSDYIGGVYIIVLLGTSFLVFNAIANMFR